jgi:uncharacterized UPF0146 family protein
MTVLTQLREIALQKSRGLPDDDFTLRGQWTCDLLFSPNKGERVFEYSVLLMQTLAQGACYCAHGRPTLRKEFIGQDIRELTAPDSDFEVAMLDAIYSGFARSSQEEHTLVGNSVVKAQQRAAIVVNEVTRQLQDLQRRPKVVHVGVVGNILKQLSESGMEVYATDLDPLLVDQRIHSVDILNGEQHNYELIENCDLALITGMTLATGTLDAILQTARENNTKVIMFAETGAWLGQEYCQTFGIDAVISEPFPFYIFEGTSTIRVHRRE